MALSLMTDGIGALALAPTIQFLLRHYGYSGTMMVLSALMLHGLVTGLLYLPPPSGKRRNPQIDETNFSCASVSAKEAADHIKKSSLLKNELDRDCDEVNEYPTERIHPLKTKENVNYAKEMSDSKDEFEDVPLKPEESHNNIPTNQNMPTPPDSKLVQSGETKTGLDSVVKPTGKPNRWHAFLRYLDVRILKSTNYLGYSLLMTCASLTSSMCNTHIAGLAFEKGLGATQISILLGIMGGVSTTMKLVSGVLFDISWVQERRAYVFVSFGLTVGVILVTVPLVRGLPMVFVSWIAFTAALSIFNTQESIALRGLIPTEAYNSGVGLSRMFRGVGVLVGPPFGGKSTFGIACIYYIYKGRGYVR